MCCWLALVSNAAVVTTEQLAAAWPRDQLDRQHFEMGPLQAAGQLLRMAGKDLACQPHGLQCSPHHRQEIHIFELQTESGHLFCRQAHTTVCI